MNPPTASPDQPAPLNFESLVAILGSVQAWKVLRVLADASSLLPNEIAEKARLPNDSVRKQLTRMRDAGMVIAPRVKALRDPAAIPRRQRESRFGGRSMHAPFEGRDSKHGEANGSRARFGNFLILLFTFLGAEILRLIPSPSFRP